MRKKSRIVVSFVQKFTVFWIKIDLSLEDAKNSIHMRTSPSFSQGNNNVKSNTPNANMADLSAGPGLVARKRG